MSYPEKKSPLTNKAPKHQASSNKNKAINSKTTINSGTTINREEYIKKWKDKYSNIKIPDHINIKNPNKWEELFYHKVFDITCGMFGESEILSDAINYHFTGKHKLYEGEWKSYEKDWTAPQEFVDVTSEFIKKEQEYLTKKYGKSVLLYRVSGNNKTNITSWTDNEEWARLWKKINNKPDVEIFERYILTDKIIIGGDSMMFLSREPHEREFLVWKAFE